MDGIKYLGVVALLADKPEAGLKRGDVGTVVEVFESNEHHPADASWSLWMRRAKFSLCLM